MPKQTIWQIGFLVMTGLLLIGFFNTGHISLVPHTVKADPETVAAAPPSRTITVVGEGSVKIKPDTAQANVGVEVVNPNLQEANSEATAAINQIMNSLKDRGIFEADRQTSGFNIWLEHPSNPAGSSTDRVLYHVSNQINVTIRDLNNVSDVLEAAIKAGANNIYSVTFRVADPSKVEATAREKAMSDARAKAEQLAGLSGAQLGDIISVSEIIGDNSGVYNNSYAAAGQGRIGGDSPISPGELNLAYQLQVTFNLQ
jgi:uncharacterized protein YggE